MDKFTDWVAEYGVRMLCVIGLIASTIFIIIAIVMTIGG
jgi:hypothetical protein